MVGKGGQSEEGFVHPYEAYLQAGKAYHFQSFAVPELAAWLFQICLALVLM